MDDEKFKAAIDNIARHCVATDVRKLNRVITGLYDEELRPLGLKTSQMNILVATAKMVLAEPKKVCNVLQLDTSTLSRNIEIMKANGWLEILSGEDARKQPFRLTSQGEKLLKKAVLAWDKAQSQAQELLGQEGVSLLARLAGKVGTN